MELIYKNNIFIFSCIFQEKEVPKQVGFRWNPKEKYWWTDEINKAIKLLEFANEETKSLLEKIINTKNKTFQQSNSIKSNLNIPAPKGLNYLDYQKAGIEFIVNNKSILLADEMGLGKTIQAIGTINYLNIKENILIICPASLKLNWKIELKKWLIDKTLTIEIAHSKTLLSANISIINYDILHNFNFFDKIWNLLIIDESHFLKGKFKIGKDGSITGVKRAAYSSLLKAKKKIYLTGTPILNKPIDLWNTLADLDPQKWNSKGRFTIRYCGAYQGRWGWDESGATNLEELNKELRSTIMIRREKEQVLLELPAKRRQIIELPSNGFQKIIKKEQELYRKARKYLRKAKKSDEIIDLDEFNEEINNLSSNTFLFQEISKIRHENAILKIPYVINHIKDCLEFSNKIIVFAHHRDVIENLRKEFPNSAYLIGGMSINEKQKNINKFQNTPCKLFFGSIKAAGIGINLTVSSHIAFAEIDWVPAIITQAEDRSHRLGQRESVLIQHLVIEGSIDAMMAKKIVEKQEVINKIMK